MNILLSDYRWHSAMKSLTLSALAIPLVLVLILLIPTNDVFAQPTLKEVLEKTAQDEEETQKPAEATSEAGKPETTKPASQSAPITKYIPQDEFNRGVPRKSIHGFLETARERDFEQAAAYLDLRNLPGNIKNIPVLWKSIIWVSFGVRAQHVMINEEGASQHDIQLAGKFWPRDIFDVAG